MNSSIKIELFYYIIPVEVQVQAFFELSLKSLIYFCPSVWRHSTKVTWPFSWPLCVCACACVLNLLSLAFLGLKIFLRKIEENWESICIFCLINCSVILGFQELESVHGTADCPESYQLLTDRCVSHHAVWIICINISELWQLFDLLWDIW